LDGSDDGWDEGTLEGWDEGCIEGCPVMTMIWIIITLITMITKDIINLTRLILQQQMTIILLNNTCWFNCLS
jgi:hypothetical protein